MERYVGSKVCRAYALAHWVILQSCIASHSITSHRIADDAASRMAAKQKLMTITESQRFSFSTKWPQRPSYYNCSIKYRSATNSHTDTVRNWRGKTNMFPSGWRRHRLSWACASTRSLAVTAAQQIGQVHGRFGVWGLRFQGAWNSVGASWNANFRHRHRHRHEQWVSFHFVCLSVFLFSMSLIINVYSSTNQRRAVE